MTMLAVANAQLPAAVTPEAAKPAPATPTPAPPAKPAVPDGKENPLKANPAMPTPPGVPVDDGTNMKTISWRGLFFKTFGDQKNQVPGAGPIPATTQPNLPPSEPQTSTPKPRKVVN